MGERVTEGLRLWEALELRVGRRVGDRLGERLAVALALPVRLWEAVPVAVPLRLELRVAVGVSARLQVGDAECDPLGVPLALAGAIPEAVLDTRPPHTSCVYIKNSLKNCAAASIPKPITLQQTFELDPGAALLPLFSVHRRRYGATASTIVEYRPPGRPLGGAGP